MAEPTSHTRRAGAAAAQERQRYARELLDALWENKSNLAYAWRILRHGVCDGCALGAYGMREPLDGVHFCMPALKLLKASTMEPIDRSVLHNIERLKKLDPQRLRSLGRLSFPLLRRAEAPGFSRISWDEAFHLIAKTIHDTAPHQLGFLAGAQGLTNELYYSLQKLARVLGTNNIDVWCSAAATTELKDLQATLGIAAATCSLADLIGTDLIVLFGADLARHEWLRKYLRAAKRSRSRIVVIGSNRPAAGAHELIDEVFSVRGGGDSAFLTGALKALLAWNALDEAFVAEHTDGLDELRLALQQQSWELLERHAGLSREAMERFARGYASAASALFVYGAALSADRATPVRAIVNLALARGMLGRDQCGILPILSHSGVQGGVDCGAAPDKFPGQLAVGEESARRFSNLWRHPAPSNIGLDARHMIESARARELKLFYCAGADALQGPAGRAFAEEALQRVALRVHQDIALNPSMLVEAEEAVLILPSQTRHEQRGGGTSTSIERRIHFTPELPRERPVGEVLPQWEIPVIIGRNSMPNGAFLFPFRSARSVREEIGRVMPIYKGVENFSRPADRLQWGGPYLYREGFTAMPGCRALFSVVPIGDGAGLAETEGVDAQSLPE